MTFVFLCFLLSPGPVLSLRFSFFDSDRFLMSSVW